jgi:hypothetical protein
LTKPEEAAHGQKVGWDFSRMRSSLGISFFFGLLNISLFVFNK